MHKARNPIITKVTGDDVLSCFPARLEVSVDARERFREVE